MENQTSTMPPRMSLSDRASARNVVLRIESLDIFEQFRDAFLADLRPAGISEEILVEQIIMCQWRLRRIALAETAALDAQAQASLAKVGPTGTPADLLGLVMLETAGAQNMKALRYHEASLTRQLRAAEKRLAEVQAQRKAESSAPARKSTFRESNPSPTQLPSHQQDPPVTPAPPGRAA